HHFGAQSGVALGCTAPPPPASPADARTAAEGEAPTARAIATRPGAPRSGHGRARPPRVHRRNRDTRVGPASRRSAPARHAGRAAQPRPRRLARLRTPRVPTASRTFGEV